MNYRDKMGRFKFWVTKASRYMPPTDKEVAAVERRFGHSFPDSYKAFVKEFGCIALEGSVGLALSGSLASESIEIFFGISYGHIYDLSGILDRYAGRLPEPLLPIAQDAFGNLVCIAVYGRHEGHVFFWNHDGERIPHHGGPIPWENVTLVADDFDQFIDSLVIRGNPGDCSTQRSEQMP